VLQSMTGFGEARIQQDSLSVTVEVRAINNRFFKLAVRATEGYAALESLVETEVRRSIHRGTVQVNLRVDRRIAAEDYRINVEVLDRYRRQLAELLHRDGRSAEQEMPRIEALLPLPGVVDDAADAAVDAVADWPVIRRALLAAMEKLSHMRAEEGRAMAEDLSANCQAVAESLDRIERRAPLVVEDYRNRLFDRLQRTLAELDVTLEPAAVIREVGLFADRSDISEEIVRLRSHLDQFRASMQLAESSGRKLDFLPQEMFRETNTIGSKAYDVEIAQCVIEIKTAIERIREMVQNIE